MPNSELSRTETVPLQKDAGALADEAVLDRIARSLETIEGRLRNEQTGREAMVGTVIVHGPALFGVARALPGRTITATASATAKVNVEEEIEFLVEDVDFWGNRTLVNMADVDVVLGPTQGAGLSATSGGTRTKKIKITTGMDGVAKAFLFGMVVEKIKVTGLTGGTFLNTSDAVEIKIM